MTTPDTFGRPRPTPRKPGNDVTDTHPGFGRTNRTFTAVPPPATLAASAATTTPAPAPETPPLPPAPAPEAPTLTLEAFTALVEGVRMEKTIALGGMDWHLVQLDDQAESAAWAATAATMPAGTTMEAWTASVEGGLEYRRMRLVYAIAAVRTTAPAGTSPCDFTPIETLFASTPNPRAALTELIRRTPSIFQGLLVAALADLEKQHLDRVKGIGPF